LSSDVKPSQLAAHNAVLAEHEAECGAGTCVSSWKTNKATYQYTARHTDIAV